MVNLPDVVTVWDDVELPHQDGCVGFIVHLGEGVPAIHGDPQNRVFVVNGRNVLVPESEGFHEVPEEPPRVQGMVMVTVSVESTRLAFVGEVWADNDLVSVRICTQWVHTSGLLEVTARRVVAVLPANGTKVWVFPGM